MCEWDTKINTKIKEFAFKLLVSKSLAYLKKNGSGGKSLCATYARSTGENSIIRYNCKYRDFTLCQTSMN